MGKYFTIKELTKSSVATKKKISNTPTKEIENKLEALIENVLDPLRELYGKPITVNSGYRCPALNKAVGGVSNSQHLTGEAADITGKSKDENKKLFELAKSLPFDQLINESNYSWVHISYSDRNRKQILNL